jgi:hypothetical protein
MDSRFTRSPLLPRGFWALGLIGALAILLPQPTLAAGGDSPFSGFVLVYDYLDLTRVLDETHVFDQSHPGHSWLPTDRGGLRFQLRVREQFSPDAFVDAALNADYNVAKASRAPNADLADGMTWRFQEGYISLGRVFPWLDLKLGRQYVFWGRFEWGSVEDVISPWDFVNMGAEKENFRVAVDAIRAFVSPAGIPINAEFIVLPWFQASRMPVKLPAEIGGMDVRLLDPEMPAMTAENVETGARVALETGNIGEVGLAWFRGFQRTFSLYVDTVADETTGWPAGLDFQQRYSRHQMFAADFEFLLGPVALLGESGFFLTEDEAGTNVFVKNRNLRSVLGIEWEPNATWRIQAQVGHTHFLDYNRQREYETRKSAGEPDPYVGAADQFSLTYKLQAQVMSELGLHLMNLVNMPDSGSIDMMMLAFASWEPREAIKVYAGIVAFRGPAGTRFGRTEDQSRLFFELRHGF